MKILSLLLALLVTQTLWAKHIDPSLFTQTARVLSVEENNNRRPVAVSNVSTGVITGTAWVGSNDVRIEIQIGDTIYITSKLSRGLIDGKVGDSFPAYVGKSHRLGVIRLLSTDSHGKQAVATLEITGQRVKD